LMISLIKLRTNAESSTHSTLILGWGLKPSPRYG
jgi:hypothetical protein